MMVDNGANIAVEVTTTLDGVRSIALVVDRSAPAGAWFELAGACASHCHRQAGCDLERRGRAD
jgi:hypothetical protein